MVRDDQEFHCPKCQSDSKIEVAFAGLCRLTPDGSEDVGDHEYDEDSLAQCGACGHTGRLSTFTYIF